jgi:hypothetical protein
LITSPQAPATQLAEQQSPPAVQSAPVSLQGKSQKPPKQRPLQQSALAAQVVPVLPQVVVVPQVPPTQSRLQHSALKVHVPPEATHGWVQTRSPAEFIKHWPLQQSASVPQPAPSPRQTPVPKMQIGGFWVVSQT